METLPELKQLSVSQKDALIIRLFSQPATVCQAGLTAAERYAHWRYVYDEILQQADLANPRSEASGRRA